MKIEIDKKKIPYEFQLRSKDRLFTVVVKHSYWQDRIYLDLLDEERNAILLGEKLVYGRPLAFHLLEDKNSNCFNPYSNGSSFFINGDRWIVLIKTVFQSLF